MRHGPQQRLQRAQCLAADRCCGPQAQHPSWYFYRETIPLLLQPTPAYGLSLLDEDLIHRDGTTEPWMPRVADFPYFSIVGVGLSTSTTVNDRIPRWAPEFRTSRYATRHRPDIAYQPLIASLPACVSAACTITTSSNPSRLEFLRSTTPPYGLAFSLNDPSTATPSQKHDEAIVNATKVSVTAMQVSFDHSHFVQQWLHHYLRRLFR